MCLVLRNTAWYSILFEDATATSPKEGECVRVLLFIIISI